MEQKELFQYVVTASVREAADADYEEVKESSLASVLTASAGPIGKDGRPRMLVISAWMVHEGRNENGQVFVREELEKIATQDLFAPPHAGMIDFDHDFQPRGFWYKTSFAFNQSANKWGILAQGAIWAWRFDELTDQLLAEMQREGHISVSMTAIPESFEITHTFPGAEGKLSQIIHNPVFLTTSILDVEPADPNALGVAAEDVSELPDVIASQNTDVTDVVSEVPEEENLMEETLVKELRQELRDAEEARRMAEDSAPGKV